MSQNQDKKGRTGIYDNLDNPEDDFITFELVNVPMQDLVSSMRRSAVHAWKDAKVLSDKVHREVTKLVSTMKTQANDKLKSVGITNPAMAVQMGTIGTAGLLGLFAARKKSTFGRILYPALAGGSVWAAFHLSSASNRKEVWSKYKQIEGGYLSSVSKYRKKTDNDRSTDSKR